MKLTLGKTLYLLLGALAVASLAGSAILIRNTLELSAGLAASAEKNVREIVSRNAQDIESGMTILERSARALAGAGEFLHTRRAELRKSMDGNVELLLKSALAKTPAAVGCGLWYEPKSLLPDRELYGPYVFRKDGNATFTWDLNSREYDYPNQSWYRLAIPRQGAAADLRDGFVWTAPYFDEAGTKSLMITADALMYDVSGQVIGMATFDYGLDQVKNAVDKLKVSEHSQTFAADAASRSVIAWSADQGLIGKRLTELPFAQSLDLSAQRGGIHTDQVEFLGEKHELFYTVTASGTVFGVLAPTSELYADTDRLRRSGLSAAAAVVSVQLLIFAFLALVARRRVIAPVMSLAGVAERAAAGDLAGAGRDLALLDESGRKDEVAVLVTSFRRMVDNLAKLIGAVQGTGIGIASSATTIAASTGGLEEVTGEHAAAASQVLASSREIAAQSEELMGTVDNLDRSVAATVATAREGRERLSGMRLAMDELLSASAGISARLAAINDKARKISDMVTTVSKISEQTNVLSLNASIEAEKAGEYGRGFSVVAREIRRLADRAAAATVDIEAVVGQMHSAVASGVMGMEKFTADVRRGVEEIVAIGGGLERVITGVSELGPEFSAVREAMRSQSAGAGQITEAMERLVTVAARTRDSIGDFGRAVDELNAVVRSLRHEVSTFRTEE